ncbi:MAG: diguanylate cyclase [Pseudomonadota bacterium]
MAGRILVVDDVSTNRIVLKVKLTTACYEVILANDAEQALRMVRDTMPDLIIASVDMDGLGGLELCEYLKASPMTAQIPILLMTGQPNRMVTLAALRAGAEDFLTKPLHETTLLARLRCQLRARDLADELHLRTRTSRELGFAETVPRLDRPGHVILMGGSPAEAEVITGALFSQGRHETTHMDRASLLTAPETDRPCDAVVMLPGPDAAPPDLSGLAELRSRTPTRHAAILPLLPSDHANAETAALDMGASDCLVQPVDLEEFTLRIIRQLRQKQLADHLRASARRSMALAATDPLTGLHNRRYAEHHLKRIMHRARKNRRRFALMLLDLDRFKSVNDSFGHSAGDKVLKEIAARLRDNLRSVDLIARFGGEEFLVVLPETSIIDARIAAERLRDWIKTRPVDLGDGRFLTITVSIGLAISDGTDGAVTDLLARADQALYASKSDGRNLVTISMSAA